MCFAADLCTLSSKIISRTFLFNIIKLMVTHFAFKILMVVANSYNIMFVCIKRHQSCIIPIN